MKQIAFFIALSVMCGLALNSCKDKDEEKAPLKGPTSCKLISQDENATLTFYHYSDDQLVMANGEYGDTTWFSYNNKGQLIEANNNQGIEAFMEYGTEKIPTKIVLKEFGLYANFYVLTSNNGLISQIETYSNGGSSPLQVLKMSYDENDQMETFEITVEDGQGSFYQFIKADSIVTDGKINPYQMDFGIVYMNFDNPFAFGLSNLVDAHIIVLGSETGITTAYQYNEFDLPTEADIDITGFAQLTKFTYQCE